MLLGLDERCLQIITRCEAIVFVNYRFQRHERKMYVSKVHSNFKKIATLQKYEWELISEKIRIIHIQFNTKKLHKTLKQSINPSNIQLYIVYVNVFYNNEPLYQTLFHENI